MIDSPFLNKQNEIEKNWTGDLPHWHQLEKMQYLTFRLNDSLSELHRRILMEIRDHFLENHPKPWDKATLRQYYRVIGPKEEGLLDAGYGSCVLKRPEIRNILVDSLHFEDGKKYHLVGYVIMPNHVHLVMTPEGENKVSTLVGRIKQYSSNRINRLCNRKGVFWKRESFDRVVRSYDNLIKILDYIISNPKNLSSTEYTLYINPDFQFLLGNKIAKY
ncbi:MAG: transposase [Muribaculaceae bacterium]|nr:transposase [Muribaculaceae bacterium]